MRHVVSHLGHCRLRHVSRTDVRIRDCRRAPPSWGDPIWQYHWRASSWRMDSRESYRIHLLLSIVFAFDSCCCFPVRKIPWWCKAIAAWQPWREDRHVPNETLRSSCARASVASTSHRPNWITISWAASTPNLLGLVADVQSGWFVLRGKQFGGRPIWERRLYEGSRLEKQRCCIVSAMQESVSLRMDPSPHTEKRIPRRIFSWFRHSCGRRRSDDDGRGLRGRYDWSEKVLAVAFCDFFWWLLYLTKYFVIATRIIY